MSRFKDANHIKEKKKQIKEQFKAAGLLVKAGECVLLEGMKVKDADEFGIGEEDMYNLVIPEAMPFKAKRAYKDSAEVSYVVP